MQCTNPTILITQHEENHVPCGKCLGCRMARTKMWSTRILHEASYHDSSLFVTLTFTDEHLPSQITKRDLQLFLKRFRKQISPRKIKYYACGEYGDELGRPHYHAIMFNTYWEDFTPHPTLRGKYLSKAWPFGIISLGTVELASANYVAGYVLKKLEDPREYVLKHPPFKIQSQGIGKQWALDNKKYIIDNLGLTVFGLNQTIPRYYLKKLDIDVQQDERFKNKALEAKNKKAKIITTTNKNDDDILSALKKMRQQKAWNQSARQDIKKKR